MLNNNKIRPRNFANQPFFSSNSTFRRDSPFHDYSFEGGGISESINHREATYRKLILTPASLHYSSTVLIVIRVVEFKKGREKGNI